MIACLLFKIYVQNLVLKTLFSLYYLYSYWSIEGVVRYVEDYGNRYGVYIQVEGDKNELIAIREGEIPQPGEKVYIHVETEKLHLFDRGTEKSLVTRRWCPSTKSWRMPKLEKATPVE